jgi:ribosomal protein S19
MLYAPKEFSHKSTNLIVSNSYIRHYSAHLWRIIYLISSNNVYMSLPKKFYNNSSSIPHVFVGYEIFIYSGLKWLKRVVSRWVIGYRLGVLTWNRKLALHKSKQFKKK